MIGGKLVARILSDDTSAHVVALVRGTDEASARERLLDVVCTLSPEVCRETICRGIKVVCGDITDDRLGLSEDIYHSLAGSVTHVIHCAASVQFDIPVDCARDVNFAGTRNLMAFAARVKEAGNLKRIAHISTAYVCGDQGGTIQESCLSDEPVFSNSYEQTKWETEQWVCSKKNELPIVIFRPSIVVGDSRTGATTAFNVLYIPISYISRGLLTALPCSPDVPLDVVPVDYVADAINHILFKVEDSVGKTFHLTSGHGSTLTSGEISQRAVEFFNRSNPDKRLEPVHFVPGIHSPERSEISSACRRMFTLVKPFLPYLGVIRSFDTTNTDAALAGTSIHPPRIGTYLERILDYGLKANWGRRARKAA